ncbi:hypothetical protein [Phenylobacterium aquaticum]|uniref:hypothetical protein n=1 Tax=Phenylobacterium aquaticum TaxID=1763816 RepID=UPI0026EB6D2F|nr:hypothetical protein [Phenylobacterium aquaticum]
MRRAVVIAALFTLACAPAALAETWKPYSAPTPNNLQWSYDADYSYVDKISGLVVIEQAVGKVGATPRMGPSAPGAADGVGSLLALDCKAGDMILIAGYSPKKPLDVPPNWRSSTPKKIASDDDKALLAAACAAVPSLPTK